MASSAKAGEVENAVDLAEEMILRNMADEVEDVEQLILSRRELARHAAAPSMWGCLFYLADTAKALVFDRIDLRPPIGRAWRQGSSAISLVHGR